MAHLERTGRGPETRVVIDTTTCENCGAALTKGRFRLATQPCNGGLHHRVTCRACGHVHHEPSLAPGCDHGQGSLYG